MGFTFYKHVAVFFSRQLRIPASNRTKVKICCLKYWINFHMNIDCLYIVYMCILYILCMCTYLLCILQRNKNVLIEFKLFPWWEDLWCFEFKVERDWRSGTCCICCCCRWPIVDLLINPKPECTETHSKYAHTHTQYTKYYININMKCIHIYYLYIYIYI